MNEHILVGISKPDTLEYDEEFDALINQYSAGNDYDAKKPFAYQGDFSIYEYSTKTDTWVHLLDYSDLPKAGFLSYFYPCYSSDSRTLLYESRDTQLFTYAVDLKENFLVAWPSESGNTKPEYVSPDNLYTVSTTFSTNLLNAKSYSVVITEIKSNNSTIAITSDYGIEPPDIAWLDNKRGWIKNKKDIGI